VDTGIKTYMVLPVFIGTVVRFDDDRVHDSKDNESNVKSLERPLIVGKEWDYL